MAKATDPRGNWMQTYSGNRFYPLDPKPEDFNLLDIAHSLSLQCRYNGHVRKFYSVAEHCVLVSVAVEAEEKAGLIQAARFKTALWGLLHDACEAYVGDMVRPLKQKIPSFSEIENNLLWVMAEAFNLPLPDGGRERFDDPIPDLVKQIDYRILLDEKKALMNPTLHSWDVAGLKPIGADIQGVDPLRARDMFIERFEALV